jgi:hypothetical protein
VVGFLGPCHTETEVQVKWLATMIEEKSPQVLVG